MAKQTGRPGWPMIIVVISLLLCTVSPSDLFAAPGAPQILNYQGYLEDDAGNPINGDKTMSFRIYAAIDADPSEALWESGDLVVEVTNGRFSVNLGEPPQPAFPQDLFIDDSRFLGITVDGTELIDRKRLVSVPYALNTGSGIPAGGIIMWSGSVNNIPQGWALCDGQNGTPDLRDRFIVGAGSGYSVGSQGGTASNNLSHSHTVNNHNHSISPEAPGTNEAGYHGHHLDFTSQGPGGPDPTNSGPSNPNEEKRASETHTHQIVGDTWPAGTHSHTVNSHSHGGATGGASPGTNSQLSSSVENRPPYYALCFIMKL